MNTAGVRDTGGCRELRRRAGLRGLRHGQGGPDVGGAGDVGVPGRSWLRAFGGPALARAGSWDLKAKWICPMSGRHCQTRCATARGRRDAVISSLTKPVDAERERSDDRHRLGRSERSAGGAGRSGTRGLRARRVADRRTWWCVRRRHRSASWDLILRSPGPSGWRFSTIGLAAAVTTTAGAIGVALAWLAVRSDLPLRRLWAVLYALPLVVPSYVGAFVLLAALGPKGTGAGLARAARRGSLAGHRRIPRCLPRTELSSRIRTCT